MSDQDSGVNSRAQSDASLTEDLVRLAASEERRGANFAVVLFAIIAVVGVFFTVSGFDVASRISDGETRQGALIQFGAAAICFLVGGFGVWANRRTANKLNEILRRH